MLTIHGGLAAHLPTISRPWGRRPTVFNLTVTQEGYGMGTDIRMQIAETGNAARARAACSALECSALEYNVGPLEDRPGRSPASIWLRVWVVLVAVLITGLLKAQTEPPAAEPAANAAAPAKKSRRLFDGKSLTGWSVSEFGGNGEVEVRDGKLMLGVSDGCTGVTWAGEEEIPKVNYEVRATAMRVDGNDFFCGMTFPVQQSFCSLIVGGWGGPVVGLSTVDGKDASRNDTTRQVRFETGRWYRIRVRVLPERIQAWIDDKLIVDQVTTGHKINIRPDISASKPFGIASWCTTAALKDIELELLNPEK